MSPWPSRGLSDEPFHGFGSCRSSRTYVFGSSGCSAQIQIVNRVVTCSDIFGHCQCSVFAASFQVSDDRKQCASGVLSCVYPHVGGFALSFPILIWKARKGYYINRSTVPLLQWPSLCRCHWKLFESNINPSSCNSSLPCSESPFRRVEINHAFKLEGDRSIPFPLGGLLQVFFVPT